MKKSKIMFISVIAVTALLLSACTMGPRAVGTPGLSADGDVVYVAYQQYVYAVDAKTGNEIWRFPDDGNAQIVFYAPPEVTGESLFVGDLANKFYKLDKETGAEVWTFSEAKGWSIAQALADGNVVYAPSGDWSLYKIDSNGDMIWQFETNQAIWAQPVIAGDTIFLGSMDHKVYALSSSGKLLWKTELGGAIAATPLFDEVTENLYVSSIGKEFIALSAKNGEKLWTLDTDGSIWAAPLLNEGQLLFADETGKIFAVNAETGKVTWSIESGGAVMAGLAAIDGGFVVVMEDGTIRAFDYEGNPLWTRDVSGELYSTPVTANGLLVIAAIKGDNLLYGFDESGNQVWSFNPGK